MAIRIILVGALPGLVVIGAYSYFETEIQHWLEHNIEYLVQNSWLVFSFGVLLVMPLLAASGYLFVYGGRVATTRRLPPPGTEVVRDTRVREGVQALVRGRIIQILALVLLLAAVFIPIFLWYVFSRLLIAA
jgi:hypothetical protein